VGVSIVEGGIGEAVTEGERHREVSCVIPPVADEHTFAVPDDVSIAREVEVRGRVLEPHRERLRETA